MLSAAMLVLESLPPPLARPLAQSSAATRHRPTENAGSLHRFSHFHPLLYLLPHLQSLQPLSIRHHFPRSRGNSDWRQRVKRSGWREVTFLYNILQLSDRCEGLFFLFNVSISAGRR